jgi:predicted GNAT family acetyltransferase
MSTTVRDNPDHSRYEVLVDDQVAGFSAYELTDGRITFTHTEVSEEYAGQGLAKKLVTEQLGDAERRGLAVVPLCTYVRKVISRNAAEYLPLVPEEERERLGLLPPRG